MTERRIRTISIELSEADKQLLQRFIGTKSDRAGEFYLRSSDNQWEIWYLFGLPIEEIAERWKTTREEATAARLFCDLFPETAKNLACKHYLDEEIDQKKLNQEKKLLKVLDLKP